MLHLVVTGDDLGYGPERSRGILECHRGGGISRSSLMVNGEDAPSAAKQAMEQGLVLGLHLNLTEGLPVSPAEKIPSLLSEGGFRDKMGFRAALHKGVLQLEEVREELVSQVALFQSLTGSLPRYVDGHQHVHVLPGVNTIFCQVLSRYNITHTRLPIEPGITTCPWLTDQAKEFSSAVVQNAQLSKATFNQHNIRYTDCFVGMTTMGNNMTIERLQSSLKEAFQLDTSPSRPGTSPVIVCELMVHPGYPCQNEAQGCGLGVDDFAMSQDRVHELEIITSGEMLTFYEHNGIQLVPGC